MKIDFKKLDNMDLAISSEPWTPEEQAAFSEFLKTQSEKNSHAKKARSIPSSRKRTKVPEK